MKTLRKKTLRFEIQYLDMQCIYVDEEMEPDVTISTLDVNEVNETIEMLKVIALINFCSNFEIITPHECLTFRR